MTRKKMTNAPVVPRKEPKQARSKKTVELVFETTASILQMEGIEKLTTNRIAQKCGISIGSLYQYFPNKQALLLAMAQAELQGVADELQGVVIKASKNDQFDLEGVIATTLLQSLRPKHRMRRILCDFAIQNGRADIVHAPLFAAESLLQESGHAPISPIKAFVLSAAIQGILRSAAGAQSPWLQSDALAHEIAKLMRSYRATT